MNENLELTQNEIAEYNLFLMSSFTKENLQEVLSKQISLEQIALNFSTNVPVTSSPNEIREQIRVLRLLRDERIRIEDTIDIDKLDFGDSK